MVEERKCVGHVVNVYHRIYNVDKKDAKEPKQNDSPPQKQNGRCSLRSKGPISKQELPR